MLSVQHGAPHHIFDPAAGGGGGGGGALGCAVFNANEDLVLYPLAATPGTFDSSAMFDGVREACAVGSLEDLVMWQAIDGSAGSTTAEVYRLRGGVFTLLGTLTLAFGGGDFARVSVVPAAPLKPLLLGDAIVVQLTAVQTGGKNVTVELCCASGGTGTGNWVEDPFTPTAAQTVFVLSSTPSDQDTVMFNVNGAEYERNVHYTLVGNTITWNNIAFLMAITDNVWVRYRT